MSPRKFAAALAVAALSFTSAAYAEDAQRGLNAGADFAGTVQWVVNRLPETRATEGPTPTAYVLSGNCTFAGLLTPNNRLQIVYGGHAEATGPQVPQLTYIRCTVRNHATPVQTDYSEFANGGPVSVTAETTGPWFVSPIIICIDAFAVFGPTPVTIINLGQQCTTLLA